MKGRVLMKRYQVKFKSKKPGSGTNNTNVTAGSRSDARNQVIARYASNGHEITVISVVEL